MKPSTLLVTAVVAILSAPFARAAGVDGDMYLLGIGLDQEGVVGGWAQVGPAEAWKATIAGTVLGELYSVESTGELFATNLQTGEWRQIGAPDFANTRFMFAAGGKLYTIETSGSMYRVNPADGTWAPLGERRPSLPIAGAVLNDMLYVVERDGALTVTSLDDGRPQRVGKMDFTNTGFLFAAGNRLYTITTTGNLDRIDPGDGQRHTLGEAGAWKSTLAVTVINDQLYSVEKSGGLYFTDLHSGGWKQIGKDDFSNTRFMFPARGQLYTIESSGNLYRVEVRAGPTIDSFNWCPQEVEKVFREQGKSFYHRITTRQVLGASATHQAALDGLAWLQQKTTARDIAVIYIGAHGETDPNEGWSIWTADGKKLLGREIKIELAKLPCPVLIMVETCTSGGFASAHRNDPPVPANVMALCACQPNQSTNNQLDLSVFEALYGRADFNKDGIVDADELVRYVEMRYKEWWPNPTRTDGSQTPVIVRSSALPGHQPLTKVSPALSAVAWQGELWSALLEGKTGDQYKVHMLGWSSRPGESYFLTNSVTRDAICLAGDGPPLLIRQKGQSVPARLIKENGANDTVYLLGQDRTETVAKGRLAFPFVGHPAP
jgi:hypothetical protein